MIMTNILYKVSATWTVERFNNIIISFIVIYIICIWFVDERERYYKYV